MSRNRTENSNRRPDLIAYHVPERENAPWARIGAAWDHKDGEGFTVELDLIPARTGRIVLRAPKDEAGEEGR